MDRRASRTSWIPCGQPAERTLATTISTISGQCSLNKFQTRWLMFCCRIKLPPPNRTPPIPGWLTDSYVNPLPLQRLSTRSSVRFERSELKCRNCSTQVLAKALKRHYAAVRRSSWSRPVSACSSYHYHKAFWSVLYLVPIVFAICSICTVFVVSRQEFFVFMNKT